MPNPPPKAIVHFEGGDIEGHLSRRMALVQWIAEYLSRDSNHCIVFENVASEPGYPWLRDSGVPYFSFQSEVYHVLTGPDHKVDAINKLISVAATDRLVGALTRCPLEPDRMVSADTIADLARDAEAVIVGAWDGAGELVWQIRRQSITQEGKIGRPRRSPNRRMR